MPVTLLTGENSSQLIGIPLKANTFQYKCLVSELPQTLLIARTIKLKDCYALIRLNFLIDSNWWLLTYVSKDITISIESNKQSAWNKSNTKTIRWPNFCGFINKKHFLADGGGNLNPSQVINQSHWDWPWHSPTC